MDATVRRYGDRVNRILILGAGPAGLAAALAAAPSGAAITIVDDNPLPGGQIWRDGPQVVLPALAQQHRQGPAQGVAQAVLIVLGGPQAQLEQRRGQRRRRASRCRTRSRMRSAPRRTASTTGTDADAIHLSRAGVPIFAMVMFGAALFTVSAVWPALRSAVANRSRTNAVSSATMTVLVVGTVDAVTCMVSDDAIRRARLVAEFIRFSL